MYGAYLTKTYALQYICSAFNITATIIAHFPSNLVTTLRGQNIYFRLKRKQQVQSKRTHIIHIFSNKYSVKIFALRGYYFGVFAQKQSHEIKENSEERDCAGSEIT